MYSVKIKRIVEERGPGMHPAWTVSPLHFDRPRSEMLRSRFQLINLTRGPFPKSELFTVKKSYAFFLYIFFCSSFTLKLFPFCVSMSLSLSNPPSPSVRPTQLFADSTPAPQNDPRRTAVLEELAYWEQAHADATSQVRSLHKKGWHRTTYRLRRGAGGVQGGRG